MKKLLVTLFALVVTLGANVNQSMASCCGCQMTAAPYCAPCAADAWAFPSNYAPPPCLTGAAAPCCATPCAAPCITGCAAPCQPMNNCCCKKRGYWYNLFHDTYKCGCGCDNCNCVQENNCCDGCCK